MVIHRHYCTAYSSFPHVIYTHSTVRVPGYDIARRRFLVEMEFMLEFMFLANVLVSFLTV